MDKLKTSIMFTALAMAAVLGAGWFLLVSPQRGEAADLRAQAEASDASNATLQNQLTMLQAQAKDLPKQQAKLAAVAAKIPENPSLPALVRALTTAATAAGVDLVSLTPSAPVLATPEVATVVTAPGAPAAPAAPAPPPGSVAATGAGGLASIPLAMNVTGDYFEIQQFLSQLETLPRALRVGNLSVSPNAGDKGNSRSIQLAAQIDGQVFMAVSTAPSGVAAPAVAAPAVAAPVVGAK